MKLEVQNHESNGPNDNRGFAWWRHRMCHDRVSTMNFRYLPFIHPHLEGKGIVGSTLISEMQAPWSLRIQYVNSRYEVVITQGKF